jgi:LPXTG-motif cell wall-anchored protein
MKKVLATLLAVMLVISTSITAFGADFEDVMDRIDSGVKYAFDGNYSKDGYDVSTSKNFNILVKSLADTEKYENAYKQSVKKALDEGTLTGSNLALAVENLAYIGEDIEDFEGYNLVKLFTSTDVTAFSDNAYSYTYAIETASLLGEDDYAKKLCDQYLTYYTMGTGTDFWYGYGTSPDDLSMFVIGLSYYADDYKDYIDDALKLLETYYTEDGYSNYGANADSTALALAAYSAVGDKDKADSVYELLEKFYDESTGGYKSDYDSYYATADAVYGLEYYLYVADFDFPYEDSTEKETTTQKTTEKTTKADTTKEVTTTASKKNTSKTSPNTGNTTAFAVGGAVLLAVGTMIALAKKRED